MDVPAVDQLFGKVGSTRDLVLVDQRGTGGSHMLSCAPTGIRVEQAAAVAEYVRRCFARLGPEVRLYTTAVAMDDLEAVRHALGYEQIDVYGASYGATAAQIYLRLHPRLGANADSSTVARCWVFPSTRPSRRTPTSAAEPSSPRCSAERACRRCVSAESGPSSPTLARACGQACRGLRSDRHDRCRRRREHRSRPLARGGRRAADPGRRPSGSPRRLRPARAGVRRSRGARTRRPRSARDVLRDPLQRAVGTFRPCPGAPARAAAATWPSVAASRARLFDRGLSVRAAGRRARPTQTTSCRPRTCPCSSSPGVRTRRIPRRTCAAGRRSSRRAALVIVPGATHGVLDGGLRRARRSTVRRRRNRSRGSTPSCVRQIEQPTFETP